MSNYFGPARQLEDGEVVVFGDLVTIYDTPDKGFREIVCLGFGLTAEIFSYPIYRKIEEKV